MKKILSAALALVCIWFATPSHAALPTGYTELQYIESTGTQYIDTGFSPDANTRVDYKGQFLQYASSVPLLGARLGTDNLGRFFPLAWYTNANNGRTVYGDKDVMLNISTSTIYTGTFIPAQGKTIINGVTYDISGANFTKIADNNFYLFATSGYAGNLYNSVGRIWYVKIWDNNTLVRDFVPAKNASGVVGMYDTVNNRFYMNAGTGEFVAGDPVTDNPCRNLLNPNDPDYGNYTVNIDGTYNYANDRITTGFIPVTGGNTLTVSTNVNVGDISGFQFVGIAEYNASKQYITRSYANAQPTLSVTLNSNTAYVQVFEQFTGLSNVTPALFATYQQQLEVGSTATAYVPYNASCHNQIKIATTKYNESAFSPLNAALANAISVVDSVVSNTITQAGRIATLQAQKQTRPNDIADDNETCPAGKKCLLVEDASGVPHWYEIVENAWDLPVGYTQLEYIESTGTQWIDTEVSGFNTGNWEIYAKWKLTKSTQSRYAHLFAVYRDENTNSYRVITNGESADNYYVSGNSKAGGGSVQVMDKPMSQIHTAIAKNGSVIFDGDLYPTQTQGNVLPSSETMIVFARKAGELPIVARIYSFWIKRDETLVRNFVPVKRNSDGVIGMYDTVSGTFFTNAGTGEFIGGQPVFN